MEPLCEPSELTQTRTEVQYDEIHRCALRRGEIPASATDVARPPRPCILFSHVERADRVEVLHVSACSTRPITPPMRAQRGSSKASSARSASLRLCVEKGNRDCINHNAPASIASTAIPVLEYVIASIAQSATPAIRPTHRSAPRNGRARSPSAPRHPQHNGNSAQIAAAAWLGFAKPSPCRTTSPTTKSTTRQPSAALDGLQHPLSYKYDPRPSLAGNLQSSHFRQVLCSIPIDLKTPNYPRHSEWNRLSTRNLHQLTAVAGNG